MKVTGIILIVIGILAIALNALLAPSFDFTQTGDDAYQVGYYIGLFSIAIVGLLLVIVGIVLFRKAERRERKKQAEIFSVTQERRSSLY